MSDITGIEWTDATWNPTVGCTKVSAGCDHCYAETLVNRFAPSKGFPNRFDVMTIRDERFLGLPLSKKWAEPRRIFVNSLSDLFHKDVPDEHIAAVFAVMAMAQQHTFQLLTKRHGRMRSLLSSDLFRRQMYDALVARDHAWIDANPLTWPLLNVWIGVSVEDQAAADLRIPALMQTPAAVRFLSMEPLLGPVTLSHFHSHCPKHDFPGGFCTNCEDRRWPDWVIVGGESGSGARPMHRDWVTFTRDQCVKAGIPFLFKQWGSHDELGTPMNKKSAGRLLDGRTWDEYPAERIGASA